MTDQTYGGMGDIRHAAKLIRESHHLIALTGAGISTPSGIPDFRSTNSGLWERYDPFEVASLNAFRHNPEVFFNWMRPLARNILSAEPNLAHIGLAQLEQGDYLKTTITQNIDGLHQRAGARNVLEIHGSWGTCTCVSCFRVYNSSDFIESYISRGQIPYCPSCANVLKPDVILMGEQLPISTWLDSVDACERCDLMIVAGSSLEVMPVARLPMLAVENGAKLIIINQSRTYIDVRADEVFLADVIDIIPSIVEEVNFGGD
jgi:NAD-dependent deacetylase